jgi:hypothetical protein
MISLICPSKGRPDKLKRMWESALATAKYPDKLYLHFGIHKEEQSQYMPLKGGSAQMYHVQDWTTVYSLNLLCEAAMKQADAMLFMVIGDDTIFTTPLWDEALMNEYAKSPTGIHVYSLRDSRGDGSPHPIATRGYIDALGYLATPIFMHWFIDTWMVEIAHSNGCFTKLEQYLLIHDKGADKGTPDETHMSIRNKGWFHRDRFTNEKCRHFLLEEKRRLGKAIQFNLGLREHVD